MATYNELIPQPGDLLSNSQPQILNNFGQLNTQFGVDHQPFDNSGSNGNGHHLQVTYDAPIATPAPASTVGVGYTKTVSGETELEFVNATHNTQITSAGLPIWKGGTVGTTGVVSLTSTASNISPGYMTLGNGLILQWGFKTNVTTNVAIVFSMNGGIAFPNNCFQVYPIAYGPNTGTIQTVWVLNNSLSATQFTPIVSPSPLGQVVWLAIGN